MKLVIAPDSFKQSLSASRVAAAIAAGWRETSPASDIQVIPMADGGEGTLDAVCSNRSAERLPIIVRGPLGDPTEAEIGLLDDGRLAVLEMASASGLHLIPEDRRDPLCASTHGTGQLIRAALDQGAWEIIVGVGGSATNDGGAGMAQALGFRLLDAQSNELPPGGAALARLRRIDTTTADPRLHECTVRVACDVTNPLCGQSGASAVYGPQKGLRQQDVFDLDEALRHYATVLQKAFGVAVADMPRAGAAGGLAAGLHAFLGARLENGAALVAEAVSLDTVVQRADLVITGEGRMDAQTLNGKAPTGVLELARRHNVPIIAIAGSLAEGWVSLLDAGFTTIDALTSNRPPTENDFTHTEQRLIQWAAHKARVWEK